MSVVAAHHKVTDSLFKALGLTGPIKRVVIDIDHKSFVTIYVERYAEPEQLAGLAKAIGEPASQSLVIKEGAIDCLPASKPAARITQPTHPRLEGVK